MNGQYFISPRPALQDRAEEGFQAVAGWGSSEQAPVIQHGIERRDGAAKIDLRQT